MAERWERARSAEAEAAAGNTALRLEMERDVAVHKAREEASAAKLVASEARVSSLQAQLEAALLGREGGGGGHARREMQHERGSDDSAVGGSTSSSRHEGSGADMEAQARGMVDCGDPSPSLPFSAPSTLPHRR